MFTLLYLWKLILQWHKPAFVEIFCGQMHQFFQPFLLFLIVHSGFVTESLLLLGESEYLSFGMHPQRWLSDLFGGWDHKKRCKNRRNVRTPPLPSSSVADVSLLFSVLSQCKSQGIRKWRQTTSYQPDETFITWDALMVWRSIWREKKKKPLRSKNINLWQSHKNRKITHENNTLKYNNDS